MHYIATWDRKIEVELIGPCTIRMGHGIKRAGVVYRRLDKDDGLTAREAAEFYRLFKEQEAAK
jgi:hypothetical protein